MPSIKYNLLTREIEMKGSESFIESNFNKIQDLMIETFGEKKKMTLRSAKENQEPISVAEAKEFQTNVETKGHDLSEASQISTASMFVIPGMSHELKVNRPPLRKYIRQVGMPGHQKIMVEVVEQKQKEISIESLREKFGLSESKLGGILRDAEKYGKVKRVPDGSYVWSQE
jgi:hypothetical protein